MDTTVILLILLFLVDGLLLYNIKNSDYSRNHKLLYGLVVLLLPVIGITIYYALRECDAEDKNGGTGIIHKILDLALIVFSLGILQSVLFNPLGIDAILARMAIVMALMYNLSFFFKYKKVKTILLFAAVTLILIATVVKIYFV